MATQRQISKEKSMAAIIDAAIAEFAEKGYTGATIRSIAANAGVANGLVSRYYDSKDRLLCSIMSMHTLDMLYEGVTDTDPYRIFCIYMDHVRKLQKAKPARFRLILRVVTESDMPDQVYDMVKEDFEGSVLEKAIISLQEEGDLVEGDAFAMFKMMAGTLYVLLNQYEILGITPPDNDALLHVLGYRREKKEHEELIRTTKELNRLKAEQAEKLIDNIAGSYNVAYTVNMAEDSYRILKMDTKLVDSSRIEGFKTFTEIKNVLSDVLHPSERPGVTSELDFGRIREKLATANSYNTEYRVLIDGVTSWHEMNITKIDEDEIAIGFAEKDLYITKRRLEEERFNEYFALLVVDLDTEMLKVLKNDNWYESDRIGTAEPYTASIRRFASQLPEEAKAFFMQLSDLGYVRSELATDNKRTYAYRSEKLENNQWVDLTSYVILRHDDGRPAMITLGFSVVDALGTAREEQRRKLAAVLKERFIDDSNAATMEG